MAIEYHDLLNALCHVGKADITGPVVDVNMMVCYLAHTYLVIEFNVSFDFCDTGVCKP